MGETKLQEVTEKLREAIYDSKLKYFNDIGIKLNDHQLLQKLTGPC